MAVSLQLQLSLLMSRFGMALYTVFLLFGYYSLWSCCPGDLWITCCTQVIIKFVQLQIWEVVYGKDNQVKEVVKVMQLKGHKVSCFLELKHCMCFLTESLYFYFLFQWSSWCYHMDHTESDISRGQLSRSAVMWRKHKHGDVDSVIVHYWVSNCRVQLHGYASHGIQNAS